MPGKTRGTKTKPGKRKSRKPDSHGRFVVPESKMEAVTKFAVEHLGAKKIFQGQNLTNYFYSHVRGRFILYVAKKFIAERELVKRAYEESYRNWIQQKMSPEEAHNAALQIVLIHPDFIGQFRQELATFEKS